MRVEMIEYTGKGQDPWAAARLLVFTKNTRLEMNTDTLQRVQEMGWTELLEELNYMATTIPSSWEFADVTFLVSGITRACAQQMTRTRTASFAMQSQRVVDASRLPATNPFPPGSENWENFEDATEQTMDNYKLLIHNGAAPQDARGILPMNIHTALVAKYNLRSLVDLVNSRKSLRTQGEYADVVGCMESLVKQVWPWSEPFFRTKHAAAVESLEELAKEAGITPGQGLGWKLAKIADMLRKDG